MNFTQAHNDYLDPEKHDRPAGKHKKCKCTKSKRIKSTKPPATIDNTNEDNPRKER